MALRKNPDADLNRKKPLFIAFGLVVVLAFVLLILEWKSFEEKVTSLLDNATSEEIEEVIVATMASAPPPPPPPPPPSVVEVMEIVDNDVEIENEVTINNETNENEKIKFGVGDGQGEGDEEADDDNTVFEVVENQPRFKGCEKITDEGEAKKCFEEKLFDFLSKNVKYPTQAKEMGIQGKVYVEFIIEKDGSVSNIAVLRDIGGGCGDESKRVIGLLPEFIPAKQRGRPVRLKFRLPINFSLK